MEVSMGAGKKHVGENGTPELDDLALPPALALSNALVRNVPRERLADLARRLVRSGADGVIDCALLVAHTRDARGGKGERAASLALLCEMARHAPSEAEKLVPLLPEYGCWRDLIALIDEELGSGGKAPLPSIGGWRRVTGGA